MTWIACTMSRARSVKESSIFFSIATRHRYPSPSCLLISDHQGRGDLTRFSIRGSFVCPWKLFFGRSSWYGHNFSRPTFGCVHVVTFRPSPSIAGFGIGRRRVRLTHSRSGLASTEHLGVRSASSEPWRRNTPRPACLHWNVPLRHSAGHAPVGAILHNWCPLGLAFVSHEWSRYTSSSARAHEIEPSVATPSPSATVLAHSLPTRRHTSMRRAS